MEWENIGVGGNSAFSSVKKTNSHPAGEFAVEIQPKVHHLGRFQTRRDFRYQVWKRAKSQPKSSRNVGLQGTLRKRDALFSKWYVAQRSLSILKLFFRLGKAWSRNFLLS